MKDMSLTSENWLLAVNDKSGRVKSMNAEIDNISRRQVSRSVPINIYWTRECTDEMCCEKYANARQAKKIPEENSFMKFRDSKESLCMLIKKWYKLTRWKYFSILILFTRTRLSMFCFQFSGFFGRIFLFPIKINFHTRNSLFFDTLTLTPWWRRELTILYYFYVTTAQLIYLFWKILTSKEKKLFLLVVESSLLSSEGKISVFFKGQKVEAPKYFFLLLFPSLLTDCNLFII